MASLEALTGLRELIRSLNDRGKRLMRNTRGVHISVSEDTGCCPLCGGPWNVQKTIPRHGKTISHGQFEIRETVHVCSQKCRYDSGVLATRRAKPLAECIIPGRSVGL